MRSLIAVLLLVCLCEAKPMQRLDAVASFGRLGIDNQIIGGSDADPNEWPWQLSQQRSGSHSCGASVLSTTKALSAAHCVDGALVGTLRVVAGLHSRADESAAQASDVTSYTMHERYEVDSATFSNDIAIINLASAFTLGSTVVLLTLPPDNNNDFVGAGCVITGWGRTSASNELPDILQEAPITPITTTECSDLMRGVIGVEIWDSHLCLYDSANQIGSCNGDSGGPCNCPGGGSGWYVAGVTSWGISSGGACQQDYPSVYTRTSAYLDWIAAN